MIKLDVTITFPDGKLCPCGELITTRPDKRGKIQGTFQYAKPFLEHPLAFALDPENLPLTLQVNSADRPQGVHAVFEDALPDDWGRKLLAGKAALTRSEQTVPRLLEALGANGLGALSFTAQKQNAKSDPWYTTCCRIFFPTGNTNCPFPTPAPCSRTGNFMKKSGRNCISLIRERSLTRCITPHLNGRPFSRK